MPEEIDVMIRKDESVSPYIQETPEETCAKKGTDHFAYIRQEMILDDLKETLSLTIKEDNTTKCVSFLLTLLNYTEHEQQNIAFVSVSSSGKSYLPIEITKLFPQDDVRLMQHQTPKAIYHAEGVLVEDKGGTNYGARLKSRHTFVSDGLAVWDEKNLSDKGKRHREKRRTEKARLKDVWEKIPKGHLVDLSRKIIVFLDAPDWRLMDELKPMLSHDKEVTRSSITEKTTSGGLGVKTIFLKGYPTVFFLTVTMGIDEQIRNRMFFLSASIAQDKLGCSIEHYLCTQSSDNDFAEGVRANKARNDLIQRILSLKQAGIKQVRFKDNCLERISTSFRNRRSTLIPRHQRDIKRLLGVIKALALLNWFNRERNGDTIIPSKDDVEKGIALYEEISKANELGIDPELYDFINDTFLPHMDKPEIRGEGITKAVFRKLWFDYAGSQLTDYQLKKKIELLVTIGHITIQKDGRENRIYANRSVPENAHIQDISIDEPEINPDQHTLDDTGGSLPD